MDIISKRKLDRWDYRIRPCAFHGCLNLANWAVTTHSPTAFYYYCNQHAPVQGPFVCVTKD
jgi:hypothetical protein